MGVEWRLWSFLLRISITSWCAFLIFSWSFKSICGNCVKISWKAMEFMRSFISVVRRGLYVAQLEGEQVQIPPKTIQHSEMRKFIMSVDVDFPRIARSSIMTKRMPMKCQHRKHFFYVSCFQLFMLETVRKVVIGKTKTLNFGVCEYDDIRDFMAWMRKEKPKKSQKNVG